MKNAIIYSLHSNEPKIDSLLQWRQTRYSIDTLRSFNSEIPIKVYLSPPGILDSAIMPYNKDNIEFIEFTAEADTKLNESNLARWTSHKWVSTFDAIERFQLDNALYVDGDTVWYGDPAKLFVKYGNKNIVYSKEDHFKEFIDFMQFENPVMNDGINMVSKHILKHKDYILEKRISTVHNWQEKYSHIDDEEISIFGIQWVSCQYAVSEAFREIGLPVGFFDREDVLLASEDKGLHEPDKSGAIVFHYLNTNSHKFLPKEYSLSVGSKTRLGKIQRVHKIGADIFATIDGIDVELSSLY